MLNKINLWVVQHNLSAHTFVSIYGMFTLFLAADASARGQVLGFLNEHPFYCLLFNFAAFAYSRYAGGHSTEGQLAQLQATPPKQVASAVVAINASSPEGAPLVTAAVLTATPPKQPT